MKTKTTCAITVLILLATTPFVTAQTFAVLHKFNLTDGQDPQGTLVMDASGNLYGTTRWGGSTATGGEDVGDGTVFEVSSKGAEKVLYNFTNSTDGGSPLAGLTADKQGTFYGVSYTGGNANCPEANYGGCGTIFTITPSGQFNVVHAFLGSNQGPIDGAYPGATLFRDHAGNLYGTTSQGGNPNCTFNFGCGTVFELSSTGAESVLYSFLGFIGGAMDGFQPFSSLVEDSVGNLYGTTIAGGILTCNSTSPDIGCGTVFELSPDGSGGWTETVLYSFTGNADGSEPYAGLVIDPAGNLYGTTSAGGDPNCTPLGSAGCGTVFKLTHGSSGWTESVLYAFPGGSSGFQPNSTLVRDSAGNLYGITANGGNTNCKYNSQGWGCGAVYKVDPSGNETVLHSFSGPDGTAPGGGLLLDSKTNTLYGTATYGGNISGCSYPEYYTGCGTVFKLVL
jgi:uncharacterized repeat protein (TIGR03803 family)